MDFNMNNLMSLMSGGMNPQGMVLSMLEQEVKKNPTPFMSNLYSLAKNEDARGIEELARNTMRTQGRDFDKEFNSFKKTMNFK